MHRGNSKRHILSGLVLLSSLGSASPMLMGQTANDSDAASLGKLSQTQFYERSEIRVIHLNNVGQQNDANEVMVALRNMVDPRDHIYLVNSTDNIVVNAPPEEIAKIQGLVNKLDMPKHAYRLTYTLSETDDGKRAGVQHFSMVVLEGQRIVLKQGDKIPVATGSYSTDKAAQETQFTYLDVGINLDSTLDRFESGLRLRSKVEQSSVAASHQTGMFADEPIVRQSVLEGTSVLTPGKPATLGGIDVVGSTRHIDIEVIAEPLS